MGPRSHQDKLLMPQPFSQPIRKVRLKSYVINFAPTRGCLFTLALSGMQPTVAFLPSGSQDVCP